VENIKHSEKSTMESKVSYRSNSTADLMAMMQLMMTETRKIVKEGDPEGASIILVKMEVINGELKKRIMTK
jgi:hypothetical protein